MHRLSVLFATVATILCWLIGVCIGQMVGHNLFNANSAQTLTTLIGGCCVVAGLSLAAMAWLHMMLYQRGIR